MSPRQSFEESSPRKLPDKEQPCWTVVEEKKKKELVKPLKFGSYYSEVIE